MDPSPAVNATAPKPAPPKPPAPGLPSIGTVKGWTYRGCWTDDVTERALISKKWKGNLTPQRCAEVCKGYRYFGLEYSSE